MLVVGLRRGHGLARGVGHEQRLLARHVLMLGLLARIGWGWGDLRVRLRIAVYLVLHRLRRVY